jgi:hypothetical protein
MQRSRSIEQVDVTGQAARHGADYAQTAVYSRSKILCVMMRVYIVGNTET